MLTPHLSIHDPGNMLIQYYSCSFTDRAVKSAQPPLTWRKTKQCGIMGRGRIGPAPTSLGPACAQAEHPEKNKPLPRIPHLEAPQQRRHNLMNKETRQMSKQEIFELFSRLNAQGMAFLVATHDVELSRRGNAIWEMHSGRLTQETK
jgi:hypothetical protein